MIFLIKNYNKAKNNIYNVGLENANLTKKQLALRIKKQITELKKYLRIILRKILINEITSLVIEKSIH